MPFRHDMICLRSLVIRIMNLPKTEQTAIQVLKVLWFLFAVGSVSHPCPNSEQDYSNAVKRLATILQRSRLNECYTHHIDLLRFCLTCSDVPKDLRDKALDLWLVEADGDIEPLMTLDCDRVVKHYLLVFESASLNIDPFVTLNCRMECTFVSNLKIRALKLERKFRKHSIEIVRGTLY